MLNGFDDVVLPKDEQPRSFTLCVSSPDTIDDGSVVYVSKDEQSHSLTPCSVTGLPASVSGSPDTLDDGTVVYVSFDTIDDGTVVYVSFWTNTHDAPEMIQEVQDKQERAQRELFGH